VVRKLIAPDGATVKVGSLIAVIGAADEDISDLLTEQIPVTAVHQVPPAAPASRAPARAAAVVPPAGPGRTLRASPLALRMAAEAGLDLNTIAGSGPQGRVVKRDIEAALAASAPVPAPSGPGTAQGARPVPTPSPREEAAEFQPIELSMMRRTIAKRLVQSKSPVPHFYLTVEVAMDRAWEAYQTLREQKSEVTLNDIIVKATAAALRRHPQLNASFGGDHVRQYTRVHIGMAVAIEDGLITPVIRDADSKSLEEIAADARVLVERARARQLQPDEYTGATFSISNLGMMGIDEFSAIINPPEGRDPRRRDRSPGAVRRARTGQGRLPDEDDALGGPPGRRRGHRRLLHADAEADAREPAAHGVTDTCSGQWAVSLIACYSLLIAHYSLLLITRCSLLIARC
jgi:pyruvate dehydrogenase E2 component (dihydrolipoamide acetyltransferase)